MKRSPSNTDSAYRLNEQIHWLWLIAKSHGGILRFFIFIGSVRYAS